MIAIRFRFPAGRYHATPWGRHVNEAEIEWPPSPWRVLRALIATWHRKADPSEFPEPALDALLHKLAGHLPAYRLPPATRAHTRHYMPARHGKKVLIFDAFVRIEPTQELVMAWPEATLDATQQNQLDTLLRDLGFLGRAESWVDAELARDWHGTTNCRPSELSVDTETGELLEPVSLIAPVEPESYTDWREHTIREHGLDKNRLRKAEQRILATLPKSWPNSLRIETGDLQAAGWSCAPGARFVTYQRPYDCFRPQPRPAPGRKTARKAAITTARLALVGNPLPKIFDAVRIGELARAATLSHAKRIAGENAIPSVLSGHDLPSGNRHAHAFYLAEDADNDGHVDHLIVHADAGLTGAALQSLDRLNRLWDRDGNEWKVLLEQYGSWREIRYSSHLLESRTWISSTPYLHPWHVKKRFGVEDQIRRECRSRGLPEPEMQQLPTIAIQGRPVRPVHFHRFRSKRGLTQPDRQGSFWRLTFHQPVTGPIALGFACHYGLGMFAAADDA